MILVHLTRKLSSLEATTISTTGDYDRPWSQEIKRPETPSPAEASFCRRKVLGNCPPTLPLRQNLALSEKSMLILARGRCRWEVSQKRVEIRRNHVGKINGNEGFKRRPHRQPLRAFVFFFFFYTCKPCNSHTSREDFGLYQILKEISPLKLQYYARGGGGLPYETDRDTRRKFWI